MMDRIKSITFSIRIFSDNLKLIVMTSWYPTQVVNVLGPNIYMMNM